MEGANINISHFQPGDITKNVLTIEELCKRRDLLLQIKNRIISTNSDVLVQTITPPEQGIIYSVAATAADDASAVTYTNADHHSTSSKAKNEIVILSNVVISNPEGITANDNVLPMETYDNIIPNIGSNEDMMGPEANKIDIVEHHDFSSADSLADPTYVSLSDNITNLRPLSPENIEWFPERDIIKEQSKDSKKRKRQGDPKNWQRQKNSRKRMKGKEYIGFKKENSKYIQNEPKSARTMGPLCMSRLCFSSKLMYCSNLTEEARKKIFETYWNMTWQEKRMYIASMVDLKPTNRKTKGSSTRRGSTKIYYLKVNNKKERVCLKTFLETLGIKEWTVRYWMGQKNKTTNADTETKERPVAVDGQRPETKRRTIKKYLSALPKLPSHHCRQSTSKLYLEPIIQSKSQLYRLYTEYSESRNETVASRKLFDDVLVEENIGLFQPKKDACDRCCALKAGNLSEEEYQKHVQLKNMARAEKNKDKEAAQKGEIHALTADLQAVKLCPFLNASALYFKTKLAVHNFSLYNLGNNKVTCYWFDETACDLKATTYASFFVDYLTKLLEENPKDVVIFTDGCTAQNRNNVVSNALLRLATIKNVVITQKYLEKGHTQMEVDSVHSVIERKLKNREIFLPSQYAAITKEARKMPCPYDVITPDYTFFKNYAMKDYQMYESIRPGRGAGDNCVVDIRAMRYNPDGSIDYKLNFADEFTPIPRRPKKFSIIPNLPPQLYNSTQSISKSKYDHLQELKSVIPSDCHDFYNNLPYK